MKRNLKANWFLESFRPFSVTQKPYTLVVDLDELAITGRPEEYDHPVKFNTEAGYFDYVVDPIVFKQLRQFQARGYRVAVVTTGAYSFEDIKTIFQKFHVDLLEENYHNRKHIVSKAFAVNQKAEYMDSLPDIFDEYCMLFDNTQENCPQHKCLFYHVDPHAPFPDLNAEFCRLFSEKLFAYKKPALAIKYFNRIMESLDVSQRVSVFSLLRGRLVGLIKNTKHLIGISKFLTDYDFFKICDHFFQDTPLWLRAFVASCSVHTRGDLHKKVESFIIFKLFQIFPELFENPAWRDKSIQEIGLQHLVEEVNRPPSGFLFFSHENETKKILITLGFSNFSMLTLPSLFNNLQDYEAKINEGKKSVVACSGRRQRE